MPPETPPTNDLGQLYLGCPIWACDQWKGTVFEERAPRRDWLRQYSIAFNTVEGNSTFYALPSPDTAKRWAESCEPDFRFSLKLPRTISHDRRLIAAEHETASFLEIATILDDADRLGPSFLQLPPDFGPAGFEALAKFLRSLPSELPWAVEVRDHGWFDFGPAEQALDALLHELGIDKVIFDSRPLFSKPPTDEHERISQSRKPRTPVRQTVTGQHPFLRIVGRNRIQDGQPWVHAWAPVITGWLKAGLSPFIFAHSPDDAFAPEFARSIHNALQGRLPEFGQMRSWPGEAEQANRQEQLSLF